MAHPPFRERRKTRVATIQYLASYFKIHRHTMSRRLQAAGVDLYNIRSLMDYLRHYYETKR